MLSSLEVKNTKQQEGERTLIAARSWLRTIMVMNDGHNTQNWFQEHQGDLNSAAAAATMEEDEDGGSNPKLASQ